MLPKNVVEFLKMCKKEEAYQKAYQELETLLFVVKSNLAKEELGVILHTMKNKLHDLSTEHDKLGDALSNDEFELMKEISKATTEYNSNE